MPGSRKWFRFFAAALASAMWTALALAEQPASRSEGTAATTNVWYSHWWVWAVGVAVFLIVVIALTNRGGRSRV